MATLFILTCLIFFGMSSAKIGFVKDLNMDAEFPPQIIKSNRRIPDGHLRPLGFQGSPVGPVEDYEGIPDAKELYYDYASTWKPVVFRDSITESPIFNTWEKDDYLKKTYGHLNISVITRKGAKKDYLYRERQTMKLKKFLAEYMYEDWYLAGTVPHDMMHELPLPKCVQCGTIANYLQEAELWMSSGGTSSMLHSHEDHNLHCVLFGRRDFILIENKYKSAFAFKEEYPNSVAGHSPLDMEMINALKYTKIADIPWTWSTLHQGDCIFIPAGYLHQVRSYGRSISVTILITPTPEFDDAGCKKKQFTKIKTLSDAAFMWTFEEGKRVLTNWKINAESLRYILLAQIRSEDIMPLEQFTMFYTEAMVVSEEDVLPAATVFAMLFDVGKREATRREITELSTEKLNRVAAVFNKPYEKSPRKKRDHLHAHEEL
ncbi:uncharacterized protein LOC126820477 [Patella vulgata]|uniref:uncharacterized protein LOC126820477 n=1 Tax=Patella vulgata TaxID=6465 RepID=UPI00217F5E74|nr:uncharacterized protein LOC126820477 [Patella vulgata]